jgi:hypothetical protein
LLTMEEAHRVQRGSFAENSSVVEDNHVSSGK